MHRDSESEISRSESKCLELRFLNKRISDPVYTGIAIKGEGGQCLKVALVDRCTGNVVKTGPEASAQVEIHAIDESFDKTNVEDWTPNEFNAKILEGRRGKLTGDRRIQLQEGIGSVDEIHFSHTRVPFPKTKLMLGAKVVNLSEGVRIREAKTESFTVKDRREMRKKDRRLSPSDEVWRLENIGKGGSFHEKLRAKRIHTVQDFLNEYERNLERLKNVLGKTMTIGKFKATVEHARTCTPDAGVMPKSVGEGSCSGLENNHASRDYPPYADEQAALVLNASRRFRYTLDLKKEEERKQLLAKIRTHAQVIRAAVLFQAAGQGVEVPGSPKKRPLTPTRTGDFDISQEELSQMSREHEISTLQQYGGVKGVAEKLKTSLEKGIHGDETDLLERKNIYGSNTYPRKKGRSFWRFLWEACRDTTLIILMVAAAASLALGIKTEGIKEGWYDGGSIALAVFIVIVVTGMMTNLVKEAGRMWLTNDQKKNTANLDAEEIWRTCFTDQFSSRGRICLFTA